MAKITKLWSDISSYNQIEAKTLYDTCERYKELSRKCPLQGIIEWMQTQTYYNRLNVATKQMLDAVAGGSLCSKQSDVAQILVEEMATTGYQRKSERNKPNRVVNIHEIDSLKTIAAQIEAITK